VQVVTMGVNGEQVGCFQTVSR